MEGRLFFLKVEFRQITTQITMTNAITTARVIMRGFDLARSKVFLKKLKKQPRSGGKVRVNYCIEKYRSLLGRRENQCKCSVVSGAWYTGETQKRPLLPLQFVCRTEARMIFSKSKYDTSLLLLKILGWLPSEVQHRW